MGWWTVLLLCVGIPTIVSPAFLVSRDTALQGPETEPRVMKKRSPENVLDQRAVEVQSVTVNCKVASRFAHTVMTSKVVNRANTSQEVLLDVELPKTAFITNFSMEIEGRLYVGEVKEKEKAKEQFEKAVSRGQTAGLVRASGRKMEKFSVSVNIAAHSDVTFMLTYEELLQRQLGQYELMIRVKPKQLVQNFEIIADIYEPQGIAFLDAYGTFVTNELLPLVEKTVTNTKAHVAFRPTVEQQRTCPTCDGTLIDGDFFIKYDVKREKDIGNIQIVNGYFVHFFAPADLPKVQKNIIFVIDISWSMFGKKIAQVKGHPFVPVKYRPNIKINVYLWDFLRLCGIPLKLLDIMAGLYTSTTREALHTILDDLHEDDHFTLILFDNEIKYWKESLVKATEENVIQAKDFVSKIEARWSTDINQAVLKAVDLLYKDAAENKLPDNSVSMIILLTDGDPSSGVTSPVAIQSNVRNAIQGNMTLFCLGFGFDLKYNFLEVMAQQNNGLARRIYEDSDAVLQLTGFYSEVASPLLSEVHLNYPDNAVNRLTQHHFKQFFNGSEIVVAGQVSDDDLQNFIFEVSAQGMNDMKFQGQASAEDWNIIFPEKEYIFGDFTERLWAYLTIQQLLAKRESGEVEEKANATAEALALSLHYNFVTPLSSMVVTKPLKDETPEDAMIADKLTEDERHRPNFAGIPIPQPAANYHAVTSVDGDPHFIIQVADLNDTLCFNIDDVPGTIFNLVKDPLSGIVVNGQTIGDKKVDPGSKVHTYFGRFGIAHQRLNLEVEVTTQSITVSQDRRKTLLSWSDNRTFRGPGVEIEITKERSLTVTMRDSAKFVIILHRVWKKHPYHRDYLGFYTLDSHLLSSKVHGLLGQFYHGLQFKVGELHAGKDADKLDATMRVKGQQLTVTWGWQRDFRRNVEYGEGVPCWFVHSNGMGLIDGTHHDYVVSEIFKTS